MLPAGCRGCADAGKKSLLREAGRREIVGSKDDNRRSLEPLGDERERRCFRNAVSLELARNC